MELAQEYANKYPEMVVYLEDLKSIIIEQTCSDVFEGNCFYHHNSLREFPELYTKQLNLFWCGKQATRICEIGFNAGHSSMLMLLGRNQEPLNFTVFDIGQHRYTAPCLDYIQQAFSHVNFEYLKGDSTIVMPEWINANPDMKQAYDLVHVDGGHSEFCASNDMKNANLLLKIGGIMIIDDTDAPQINKQVDIYIASGKYVEIPVLKTFGYPHRILRKVI
jgi:predicted O-methyltransferase YrrM